MSDTQQHSRDYATIVLQAGRNPHLDPALIADFEDIDLAMVCIEMGISPEEFFDDVTISTRFFRLVKLIALREPGQRDRQLAVDNVLALMQSPGIPPRALERATRQHAIEMNSVNELPRLVDLRRRIVRSNPRIFVNGLTLVSSYDMEGGA